MSKIWFSSDWHLGHFNIHGPKSNWEKGYRNFNSVEEMDYIIINNINKYCKPEDTIYFLGDFCFGGHQNTPNYRNRIACQTIHFIKGNHDSKIDYYKNNFSSVQDTLNVKHGKHNFFLSHYSHRIWEGSHKGYIHLYGHSHGTIPDYGKSMDVGIDVARRLKGDYLPFSIEEIISIMEEKQIEFVDHHNVNTNVK